MYNDPGADQPVSALENANGFHIELNENAPAHVSRFYQPPANTGSPTFFEYALIKPFMVNAMVPVLCGSRTEGRVPSHLP
jgi:hypothetical protein